MVMIVALLAALLRTQASAESLTSNEAREKAYPSCYADTMLRQIVQLGIEHTIRERYAIADSMFAALSKQFPQSPIGPLFRAAVLQTRMIDREDGRQAEELQQLLDEAIDKSQQWRENAPGDPEPLFYQAVAYGYGAVHESHWGGWFAALKQGLKAANRFKEIIELDPTFMDAYVGLGNYLYWKSAKMSFITWLPFVPDDREKGIAYLQRAAEKGVFAAQTARTSLMWAYLDFGLPNNTLEIAEQLHQEYPESKVFWWGIGLASYESYRWRECIAAFDSLEARYSAEGPGNYFNLIMCAYYKAKAAHEAGDFARCREECRKAFADLPPTETTRRLKGKLGELEELYRRLNR